MQLDVCMGSRFLTDSRRSQGIESTNIDCDDQDLALKLHLYQLAELREGQKKKDINSCQSPRLVIVRLAVRPDG